MDGAELQVDARQDATVDVTLGGQFVGLKAADKVTLDPAKPLVGPPGCIPYAQFAAAAPTPTGSAPPPTTAAAG